MKPEPLIGRDIAVIFGAGASAPPLVSQQELVQDLLLRHDDSRLRPAQKYLGRTFPGLMTNKSENGLLRFEDIVGPLEIAESEEYWYHFGGRAAGKRQALLTNKQVLDSLDTWVAMVLDPESLPKPGGHHGTPEENKYRSFYEPAESAKLPYAQFVSFLSNTGLMERSAFLSMNYDILLDRVLHASLIYKPDYRIDGFYEESAALETSRSLVTLLKLHGSLNWRVCDRCHVLRNLKEFAAWPNSGCVDCDGRFAKPMLIRPTLLKDFRHRVWRDIWREAGHVMSSARVWVFVGYSLPMADVWMLRLLAQSARSGGISPEKRTVIVVNPDPSVKDRFSLLFPNLKFRQQTFQNWAEACASEGRLAE